MSARTARVQRRSRRNALTKLGAIFLGMVIAGMLLPYGIGERTQPAPVGGDTQQAVTEESEVLGPAVVTSTPPSAEGVASVTDDDPATAAAPGPAGAGPAAPSAAPSPAGPTSAPTPAQASSGSRTATDVGVTADAIKVGVLLLDLGGASAVGFGAPGLPSPEGQQRIWEAHLAEWNGNEGVNGRKIVAVYRRFDPLSSASREAACLALTADAKVFAVFDPTSGYNGGDILCFTERHDTTFVGTGVFNNTSAEIQRRSGNRLFGFSMRGVRILQNATLVWDRLGLLRGKTIGVLDWNVLGNPQTVDEGLIRTLERRGHEVARRIVLPERYEDGASQIPIAVQQMRGAGVDLVVHVTAGLYMAQFSQAAESQGYRPGYVTSDWALNGSDFTNQNNAASFDGTTLVTTFRGNDLAHIPVNAAERRCDGVYARRLGPPPKRESESSAWNVSQLICGVLDVFVRGARAAGPDLTRDSFAGGTQRLGTLEVPMYLGGAFGPGKHDLANQYYVQRWRANCKCYRVVSGPHAAPVT